MMTHIWKTETENRHTEYSNEIAVQICLLEKTLCGLIIIFFKIHLEARSIPLFKL